MAGQTRRSYEEVLRHVDQAATHPKRDRTKHHLDRAIDLCPDEAIRDGLRQARRKANLLSEYNNPIADVIRREFQSMTALLRTIIRTKIATEPETEETPKVEEKIETPNSTRFCHFCLNGLDCPEHG